MNQHFGVCNLALVPLRTAVPTELNPEYPRKSVQMVLAEVLFRRKETDIVAGSLAEVPLVFVDRLSQAPLLLGHVFLEVPADCHGEKPSIGPQGRHRSLARTPYAC